MALSISFSIKSGWKVWNYSFDPIHIQWLRLRLNSFESCRQSISRACLDKKTQFYPFFLEEIWWQKCETMFLYCGVSKFPLLFLFFQTGSNQLQSLKLMKIIPLIEKKNWGKFSRKLMLTSFPMKKLNIDIQPSNISNHYKHKLNVSSFFVMFLGVILLHLYTVFIWDNLIYDCDTRKLTQNS